MLRLYPIERLQLKYHRKAELHNWHMINIGFIFESMECFILACIYPAGVKFKCNDNTNTECGDTKS